METSLILINPDRMCHDYNVSVSIIHFHILISRSIMWFLKRSKHGKRVYFSLFMRNPCDSAIAKNNCRVDLERKALHAAV